MKDRLKVMGNIAILKVLTGRPGDVDTGLILHGADDCYSLAEMLVQAGDKIRENEEHLSFADIRARKNFEP